MYILVVHLLYVKIFLVDREDVEWIGEVNNISLLFYVNNYDRKFTRIDMAYTIENEGLTDDSPGDNEGVNQENDPQEQLSFVSFLSHLPWLQ